VAANATAFPFRKVTYRAEPAAWRWIIAQGIERFQVTALLSLGR